MTIAKQTVALIMVKPAFGTEGASKSAATPTVTADEQMIVRQPRQISFSVGHGLLTSESSN